MSEGRLQQVGTPQEVYAEPQTVFVAQFIGTPPMNVLPAGMLEGEAVRVGFRPEDAVIATEGDLRGTVRLVEQLGHEVLVFCDVAGVRVTARLPASAVRPAIGDQVSISVAEAARHRFDATTGERKE
jgi:ABC-type sugar transport system ATPase subunit